MRHTGADEIFFVFKVATEKRGALDIGLIFLLASLLENEANMTAMEVGEDLTTRHGIQEFVFDGEAIYPFPFILSSFHPLNLDCTAVKHWLEVE